MDKNNSQIPMTREGLDELKEELRQLVEEKRPEIVKRMADSRTIGDMTEDSEYSQAKQELVFIDGRISELEEVVGRSVIVGKKSSCQEVALGCQVTVKIGKTNQAFHLVGEWEADPLEQKISHQSPLGQALLGKKVGEKVEVDAPAGKVAYTIVKIS
ncbi:transcription elongation factor GreA [Patescibacteria group bacterium]